MADIVKLNMKAKPKYIYKRYILNIKTQVKVKLLKYKISHVSSRMLICYINIK